MATTGPVTATAIPVAMGTVISAENPQQVPTAELGVLKVRLNRARNLKVSQQIHLFLPAL